MRTVSRGRSWIVLVALLAGCSAGPRLKVAADQAELPFGATIEVDGLLSPGEWDDARVLPFDLPDGRRVEILVQRDRSHFSFAFTGLDDRASLEVHPEILFDLWGNGSESFDDNDWWFSIGRELCWQRGGFGDGDCRLVPPGWEATPLPVERDRVIEVAIGFDAVRFTETYDGTIGLAFRFVDATGTEVGVWPLRAQVRHPRTWAPISLRH